MERQLLGGTLSERLSLGYVRIYDSTPRCFALVPNPLTPLRIIPHPPFISIFRRFANGESVTELWTIYPLKQPRVVKATCSGIYISDE